MSERREKLDQRLRWLALNTYFAADAEQSEDLRRRADVLMASLESEFCDEVASKAATYAHTMSEGFGAKKNREGARMLQAVQARLDDPEWRSYYQKGHGNAAKDRRLAVVIAGDLLRVLENCQLAKQALPLLEPDEQLHFLEGRVTGRVAVYLADRNEDDHLHPTERMAAAIYETLQRNKDEPKPIVVAALKSLGCDDDVARSFVRKTS